MKRFPAVCGVRQYPTPPIAEFGGFRPDRGDNFPARSLRRKDVMEKRLCDICGHSRAAHVDGVHCALCRCSSERTAAVQQSLVFRNALPIRTAGIGRKR
jgi:hypothetical protein